MAQFVEFKVGKESFCIDINKVEYIERYENITQVPNTPTHVEGLTNVHGQLIAIYNLHEKFGLSQIKVDDNTAFIIVNVNDLGIGIMVDKVLAIVDSKNCEFEPTPKIILSSSKYISGVLKLKDRLIMILDVEKIINESEQDSIANLINSNQNT